MNARAIPLSSLRSVTATAWLLWLLMALGVLAWSTPTRAETSVCTEITSLPATINSAGHYCLQKNFAQSFSGSDVLRINADDVLLDCNDHLILNTNASNTADAIYGPGERKHVTIRNCTIDGFYVGIFLQASSDPGADGNRIQGNAVLHSRSVGIYIIGSNNLVEGNRVSQSTGNYNGVTYGIFMYSSGTLGVGNVIRDNVVSDFKPTPPVGAGSSTEGISFSNLRNTLVTGNVVSGLYATTSQGVFALVGYDASGTTVSDNVIVTPPAPAAAPLDGGHYYGIYMPGTAEEMASNVCRDNVVGHYNGNVYGCVVATNTGF